MAHNELINGVSFEEWASACGRIAQGASDADVMRALKLEKPVWDETNKRWGERLGDMMRADMGVASLYGDIFSDPNRGRFAAAASGATSEAAILKVVPTFTDYQKILTHQSVAAKYGTDPVTILEGYGIDLGKWGALNMHYLKVQNKMLEGNGADEFIRIHQGWTDHWEKAYAANRVDLAKDIEF